MRQSYSKNFNLILTRIDKSLKSPLMKNQSLHLPLLLNKFSKLTKVSDLERIHSKVKFKNLSKNKKLTLRSEGDLAKLKSKPYIFNFFN